MAGGQYPRHFSTGWASAIACHHVDRPAKFNRLCFVHHSIRSIASFYRAAKIMAFNPPPTRKCASAFFCAPDARRSHARRYAHIDRPQPRALLRRRALHPKIMLASEWFLPSICLRAVALRGGRRACARVLAPPASRLPPPCRAGRPVTRAPCPIILTIAPTARADQHPALLNRYAGRRFVPQQYAKATERKGQHHGRASGARGLPKTFAVSTSSLRTPRSAVAVLRTSTAKVR